MNLLREPKTAERKSTAETAFEQIVLLCENNDDLIEIAKIASQQLQSDSCSPGVLEGDSEVSNSIQLRGAHWFIRFHGCSEFSVPNCMGMRYIATLLDRPTIPIHALHLRNLERCFNPDRSLDSSVPLCDLEALAAYRQRQLDINEEIQIAKLNQDLAAVTRLDDAREQLLSEIKRVVGWSGRIRESSEAERARKSVQRAINRARNFIREVHPQLGRHLDQIKTGYQIVYCPEVEIIWDVSSTI